MNRSRTRIGVLGLGPVRRNERGMTLIETLVAVALLGAVGVVFLTGLTVSSKAVMVSQERVAAESLAKSQMEYVKSSTYDDVNNPPIYDVDPSLPIPSGYSISVSAERLDPGEVEGGDDYGLQKIAVTVDRDGDTAFTLVGYKVDR